MINNHYRIPYMGSKHKMAEIILKQIMVSCRDYRVRPFYDCFCGGGAVSYLAAENNLFKRVVANDYEKGLIELHKRLRDGGPVPHDWVSREDFKNNHKRDDWYGAFVRCCFSFSNRGATYLFGKDIEPIKKNMHYFLQTGQKHFFYDGFSMQTKESMTEYQKSIVSPILDKWRAGGGYQENYIGVYKRAIKSLSGKRCIQELQQLEQLQRLQQLERLQQLQRLERLEFINGSYEDLQIPQDAIVYCDPPYRGTETYDKHKDKSEQGFDYDAFYSWLIALPNKYVFISEYEMPADFVSILKIEKKTTMVGGSRETKPERVFVRK